MADFGEACVKLWKDCYEKTSPDSDDKSEETREWTDEELQRAEKAFSFYRSLGSPQRILAPMVEASELPWRLLSRRYGAELVYTPMLHAATFVRDARYRRDSLVSCPEDQPLVVQFCANDPTIFAEAASLCADTCVAVDLNLGCPQSIARRGHYGAFLQDEWDLVASLIRACVAKVDIPITAKVRVFPDVERTLAYARMLVHAGVSILTVHGRTREQKGVLTGLASWEQIRAVKQAVPIPVFANGNIQYLSDVERCISETGVDGVMSAEGNLHNPAIFAGLQPPVWQMAEEYLDLVRVHRCPMSCSRSHCFKLFHHAMHHHPELRSQVGNAKTLDALLEAVICMKKLCQEAAEKHAESPNENNLKTAYNTLTYPYWLCQPYVRPPRGIESSNPANQPQHEEPEAVSVTQAAALVEFRKRRREEVKQQRAEKASKRCRWLTENPRTICAADRCGNVGSARCSFDLCRHCCFRHVKEKSVSCPGHELLRKRKTEVRRQDISQATEGSAGT